MNSLDASKYTINIPSIKMLLDDKSEADRLEFIGNVAVYSGVPIIVVCHYVGLLYGYSNELLDKIERLKAFYQVDEVTGV